MNDRGALLETTRCLCLASRRAARTITRAFDHALREHGLRATQFTLLAALELKGPQTINQLADLLGAERTTISRNLGVIVGTGLARLDVSLDDGRARIASVTLAGRRKLGDAIPVWRATQNALTADIGEPAAVGLRRLAGGPCVLLDAAENYPSPRDTKP